MPKDTLDVPPPRRPGRRRKTIAEDGPDPIDVQVGRRMHQARLRAGLRQGELGDAIGVSFQAIQKYENGENRLSASRLLRAARALGRPVEFFFEGALPGVSTGSLTAGSFGRWNRRKSVAGYSASPGAWRLQRWRRSFPRRASPTRRHSGRSPATGRGSASAALLALEMVGGKIERRA